MCVFFSYRETLLAEDRDSDYDSGLFVEEVVDVSQWTSALDNLKLVVNRSDKDGDSDQFADERVEVD